MGDGQADHGNGHEDLVCHRIDDGPHDGFGVVASGEVAVDAVGESGIGEETECRDGLGGEDEVPDQWRR